MQCPKWSTFHKSVWNLHFQLCYRANKHIIGVWNLATFETVDNLSSDSELSCFVAKFIVTAPFLVFRFSSSDRDSSSLLHIAEHRRTRTDSEATMGSVGSCSTIPPVSKTQTQEKTGRCSNPSAVFWSIPAVVCRCCWRASMWCCRLSRDGTGDKQHVYILTCLPFRDRHTTHTFISSNMLPVFCFVFFRVLQEVVRQKVRRQLTAQQKAAQRRRLQKGEANLVTKSRRENQSNIKSSIEGASFWGWIGLQWWTDGIYVIRASCFPWSFGWRAGSIWESWWKYSATAQLFCNLIRDTTHWTCFPLELQRTIMFNSFYCAFWLLFIMKPCDGNKTI